MPRARCIAIGLNEVNHQSTSYVGVDIPTLKGCVNDANGIAALIKGQANYDVPTVLANEKATYQALLDQLNQAAADLQEGDFLLLHYSGHGMQGVVKDGQIDATSPANSAWILYDKPLASDELYHIWFKFRPHICVLVLSDSCHSGRAIRDRAITIGSTEIPRGIDENAAFQVISHNFDYFKQRETSLSTLTQTGAAPNANVVLISGCQEAEVSLDGTDSAGTPHGLFSAAVLETMKAGFTDDYNSFYSTVRDKVGARTQKKQNPNYLWVGGNFFELGMFGRLKPPFKV